MHWNHEGARAGRCRGAGMCGMGLGSECHGCCFGRCDIPRPMSLANFNSMLPPAGGAAIRLT